MLILKIKNERKKRRQKREKENGTRNDTSIYNEELGKWVEIDLFGNIIEEEFGDDSYNIPTKKEIKSDPLNQPNNVDYLLSKNRAIELGFKRSSKNAQWIKNLIKETVILSNISISDVENVLVKKDIYLIFASIELPDSKFIKGIIACKELDHELGRGLVQKENSYTRVKDLFERKELKFDHHPDYCLKFYILSENAELIKSNLGNEFMETHISMDHLIFEFTGYFGVVYQDRNGNVKLLENMLELINKL